MQKQKTQQLLCRCVAVADDSFAARSVVGSFVPDDGLIANGHGGAAAKHRTN